MAKHADAANLSTAEPSTAVALVDADAEPVTMKASSEPTTRKCKIRWSSTRYAATLGLVALFAVCAMGAWLGWQSNRAHQTEAQRAAFIQAGRSAAVNLTTINDTDVEAAVQRILNGSTGTFHDDFNNRAQPFIDVVKQAKSKSQGTVTEAGLESVDGNQAHVLVAVSVTTIVGSPDQQPLPRAWRMRITVEKNDDALKVSDVQFVP